MGEAAGDSSILGLLLDRVPHNVLAYPFNFQNYPLEYVTVITVVTLKEKTMKTIPCIKCNYELKTSKMDETVKFLERTENVRVRVKSTENLTHQRNDPVFSAKYGVA